MYKQLFQPIVMKIKQYDMIPIPILDCRLRPQSHAFRSDSDKSYPIHYSPLFYTTLQAIIYLPVT